jgi:hypothetical protein
MDVVGRQELPGFGYRFKVHESEERFSHGHAELVPLSGRRGTRTYFHGKPYRLEPDYQLTVALNPAPPATGQIGVVERSSWEGLRHRELGQAQGWYYSADRTLVLWECYLEAHFRAAPPYEDPLHLMVWQTWERFLLHRSPGVARVVTTWEDIYDRDTWRVFLEGQGYEQIASVAFSKPIEEATRR